MTIKENGATYIKYNGKTYAIPRPFNECNFGSNPTKETNNHE